MTRFYAILLSTFLALLLAGSVSAEDSASGIKEEPPAHHGGHHSATEWTPSEVPEGLIYPGEEKHLSNIRQLTFDGENAEAYFNPDGTKLILQRHIPEFMTDDAGVTHKLGCDQIYVMDIASGEMEMVSSGEGVTTCAYFKYPVDDKIIYASTHLYHDNCPPPADRSLGYVWKFHPEYDVFMGNPDGSDLIRLTDSWGYDAECVFAPDGSKILYTSVSGGDLDLWTMNPDGTGKTQLTNTLGYDGGGFFSWDSKKIVWRAGRPKTDEQIASYKADLEQNVYRPSVLNIFVMNTDGSDVIQVTNDDKFSNWAPFFFVNNERIIFASNREGWPMNFSLYAINVDGSDLERITYFEGFDGFPMFSPDGTKLVFASNRNQSTSYNTNIFIADWTD